MHKSAGNWISTLYIPSSVFPVQYLFGRPPNHSPLSNTVGEFVVACEADDALSSPARTKRLLRKLSLWVTGFFPITVTSHIFTLIVDSFFVKKTIIQTGYIIVLCASIINSVMVYIIVLLCYT